MPRNSRSGVTILEVVVVIGVIAILVAILLPAVQSARESARRVQCQNNLRQIMVAAHSIHETEGALPSLYNGTKLSYPLVEWDLFHMHSWLVPLLPYLEQSALREKVVWDAFATGVENTTVAQTVVPTFICPSGGDPGVMGGGYRHEAKYMPPDEVTDKDRFSGVRSDYDAMAGIQVLPVPLPATGDPYHDARSVRWGIWGWAVFDTPTFANAPLLSYRRGKFSDVTDGLSNTIAVVERGGKPIDMLNGKPNVTATDPNAEYPSQVGWSVSNTFSWSINADGVGVNESNTQGIYSLHPGGAYVAIADGSVRFLSDSTDFATLVKLFARSDGGYPE